MDLKQQNSYFINHLLGTVTTQWLDGDSVVTVHMESYFHIIHIGEYGSKTANSYFINHLLGTVTTRWLDGDSVVTVDNCWQHGDYTGDRLCSRHAASSSMVSTLSLSSHCVVIVPSRWLME